MSDLNVYQIESVELTGGEESGKELRLNCGAENQDGQQDYQGLQSALWMRSEIFKIHRCTIITHSYM